MGTKLGRSEGKEGKDRPQRAEGVGEEGRWEEEKGMGVLAPGDQFDHINLIINSWV
jgi:hypothetical protein